MGDGEFYYFELKKQLIDTYLKNNLTIHTLELDFIVLAHIV